MLNQFGTDNKMYLTDTGNLSPWPGSLTIVVRVLQSLAEFYQLNVGVFVV